MKSLKNRFTTLPILSLSIGLMSLACAKNAEPDYTKGAKFTLKNSYWALGPTGAFGNIWSTKALMIQIQSVEKGTPADGKLQVGDVILGASHKKSSQKPVFKSDARKILSAAITEAEKKENAGNLYLNVWRKGKTGLINIKLPVKGTFSKTAPWNCDKTDALVKSAV